jgi:hypothetical protein
MLEDAVDGFWEHPFAFAWMVHKRYRSQMIDVFAGRIFEVESKPVIEGFRKLLGRTRRYDSEREYSLPIGSRYQSELSPLWMETSHEY